MSRLFQPLRAPLHHLVVRENIPSGGRSFRSFGVGLPAQHAYHLVYRHGLDVSADGGTLALGSTTGGLWTRADAGERWNAVSRDLPPVAVVRFAA